jgi:hypothetical protein
MGSNVFANGMEISGKATPNKSVAAMPDVCLSPPSPPAGPIPIPYPNTSTASGTTSGTRSVKIGQQELGMKNEAKYKNSNGDQPATNSFGAGVITHKLGGPVKFSAWSMDVKAESANTTRFMDLTTHNHMNAGNGAITSSIAGMSIANIAEATCEELSKCNEEARGDMQSGAHGQGMADVGNANATITHGRYTSPSGVSGMVRACSRAVVHQYDNSFNPGLSHAEKTAKKDANGKVASAACGDHVYKRAFFHPHTSHTEARIIEDIFKANPAGGGSLLISIDWPGGPNKGLTSKSPCTDCNDLICEASKCMEIKICDPNDEPQDPECKGK